MAPWLAVFTHLVLFSQAYAELPEGAFAQLGGTAYRHPDKPLALAYRPDGTHLASGGSNGIVRIWNTDGVEVSTLKVKDGTATLLVYTTDGQHLAAHFSDEKVRIYDASRGYVLLRTVAVKNLDSLTISDDAGTICGATTGGQLIVAETATGLDRLELPEGKCAAISPDGMLVAASNAESSVAIYALPGGRELVKFAPEKGEQTTVAGIQFSPDNSRIAVACEGETNRVKLFDVVKKERVLTIDGELPLAFFGKNRLSLRQAGKLAVYDLATSKQLHALGQSFTVLAVTADGTSAATDNTGFATARIRRWNLKTGIEELAKGDLVRDIRGVVAVGDSSWIVETNRIVRWSPGRDPETIHTTAKPIIAFARSSANFYTTDGFKIFQTPLGLKEFLPKATFETEGDAIRQLAVAADDYLVAVATAGDKSKLVVAGIETGKWVPTRTMALPSPALGLAVHPKKKSVAVIGRDGQVRVWNPTGPANAPELWKARVARSLKSQIAFSADGLLLAVTSVVRVSVFDAANGESIATFDRQWEDGPYSCVAFSPDSRLLFAGTQGTTGAVAVWELSTISLVKRFLGQRGSTHSISLSSDGKTLATVASDDSVLLWDVPGRRGLQAPTDDQLKKAWSQLANPDAEVAWPAVEALRTGGAATLKLVRTGIADARTALESIDKRIVELGSRDFKTRDAADQALAQIGAPALVALKRLEEKSTDAEVRERAEKLIAKIVATSGKLPNLGLVGEPLRLLRAVAVLDAFTGDEVNDLLKAIELYGGPARVAAGRSLAGRK